MGRPRKYSDEERALLNRYRSKIYYYKKALLKLEERIQDLEDEISQASSNSLLVPTLQNVRSLLSDEEAYTIHHLFNDDEKYFSRDFREVLIEAGYTKIAESVSILGGYGPLKDFIEGNKIVQKLLDARAAYNNASKILNETVQSYRELIK